MLHITILRLREKFSDTCHACVYVYLHSTVSRSQWPCGLRCDTAAPRLLGMCVRIPPGISAWYRCYVLSGTIYATDWSFVQRSPTDCGVSEYDREASIMRRPLPTRSRCARWGGGGNSAVYNLYNLSSRSVCSVDQPMDRDTNLGLEAILSWWHNNELHDYFREGNKSEQQLPNYYVTIRYNYTLVKMFSQVLQCSLAEHKKGKITPAIWNSAAYLCESGCSYSYKHKNQIS